MHKLRHKKNNYKQRTKSDEMVISSSKYEVVTTAVSSFESRMALTVRRMTASDVGGYRCVAKNSLGEVDSVIRLYGKCTVCCLKDLYEIHILLIEK